jgi:NADH-quinone oxidoreductase subunit H
MEAVDQIFVTLKHWCVAHSPENVQWLVSILLSVGPLMGVFALAFGLTTVIERKALGRVQNRFGPNRVGIPLTKIRLAGFGQFMADGIKMLTKEDIVPFRADKVVHFLAPLALAIPVWLTFAVSPFVRNMAAIDLDAGLLFFFALGASSELAVFMAGWASRNKYSLVGAMRGIAQMISYEIPLVLSTIAVVMIVGSLSLNEIVTAQLGYTFGFIPNWHVFTPWGLAAFLFFMIAACAETNRAPFDLPEAESEIIAGYLTEYSGFKYALFFLGEYLGLFAITGFAVTLFLGGWTAPLPFLNAVPSWLWFFLKFATLIVLFIWVRATVPRLRMDQLMKLAWKFLVPLTLFNLLVAAVWHFSGVWNFTGAIAARWLICGLMIAGAYVVLGRALHTKQFPPTKAKRRRTMSPSRCAQGRSR